MRITNLDGMTQDVDQLHCTAWRDMAAPSDTKVISFLNHFEIYISCFYRFCWTLHMLFHHWSTACLLFLSIAVQGLVELELSSGFTNLLLISSIRKSRSCLFLKQSWKWEGWVSIPNKFWFNMYFSQRKQMVQKDVQYIYLHKCLLDFLVAMESDYE